MTRINLATNNGFMFVDGKLRAYEFKSAIVNFSSGEVTYTCMLGGEEKTFTTEECPKVYMGEEEFKQGITRGSHEYSWAEAIRGAFFYVSNVINDSQFFDVYAIKGNEVVSVPAPKNGFIYNGRTSHPACGQLFATREDALLHCDIIVVDENGQETTTLSPASRVALNEEQKKAVEALEKAFREVCKLGVSLVADACTDQIFAYSHKDVKQTEYGWSNDAICEQGYKINDLMTPTLLDAITLSKADTSMHVKFDM